MSISYMYGVLIRNLGKHANKLVQSVDNETLFVKMWQQIAKLI